MDETTMKFKAKISKMGGRFIINIPTYIYDDLDSFLNKKLDINIEERKLKRNVV